MNTKILIEKDFISHSEKYNYVMQELLARDKVSKHFLEKASLKTIPKITTEDFISIWKNPSSIENHLVKQFVELSKDIINTLPSEGAVSVSNKINNIAINGDTLNFIVRYNNFQRQTGGTKLSELPEGAQWSAAVFECCTPNDITGLEKLALLADCAQNVCAFMVSHHVLTVLGGGVGLCFLNSLVKECGLANLYRSAIAKIRHSTAFSYSRRLCVSSIEFATQRIIRLTIICTGMAVLAKIVPVNLKFITNSFTIMTSIIKWSILKK